MKTPMLLNLNGFRISIETLEEYNDPYVYKSLNVLQRQVYFSIVFSKRLSGKD